MLGLVLAALLTSIAPSAAAETVDLGLADLGQRPTLTLDIPPAEAVITIPVPDGLRPAELTGTLEVTGGPDPGLVEVRDGTRRLAVVDLRGQRGVDLPVTVPLADATVTDRAVILTVTRTGTTQCDDGLLADRTTLRDLVVRYRGSEAAPDTVADFLPPVLAGLDLYLTDSASLEVKAAAVSLANAVAARYTPAAPPIRLRPLSAAGVSPMTGPLRRAIVLTGTGEGSLRLAADGRVLEITGAGDALAAQVSGLTSDLGRIALASRAVASRPQVRTELARTTQNLTELGLGSPTALGRGQATLTLGIDAVMFGTPAADWRARVVGTVATGAPPSASGHRGTVTLTANGQAVASWPIPEDGRLDLSATVPGTVLGRYAELQLTAVVNGSGGCADRPPVRITLDPASTVTATPAQPPYTGGFADLPAALRPVYQVATDGRRLADLNRVLQLVLALQRQVRSTLDPQLVEPPTLLASSAPGILVTTASVPDDLDLPLRLGDDELRLPDGRSLHADADLAVAEVSATADRLLLVVAGTRADLTAGLLDWLGDPAQFGSLRGDVAVWDGRSAPITLAVRSGAPPTAPPVVSPWWQSRAVRLIAIAVVAAAVLGLIVGRVMVRRRRPGGAMAAPLEASGPTAGPSGDGPSRDG